MNRADENRGSRLSADGGVLSEILAAKHGAAQALVCPEVGLRWSHDRLALEVAGVAHGLTSLGVQGGDRVAFVLPNGPEVIVLLLAITSLGAGAAPLNPAYTEPEFSFYLDDLQPRLLVLSTEGNAAALAANLEDTDVGFLSSGGRGEIELRSEAAVRTPSREAREARPGDIALLLHTSGTTSRPKQVPLLHRNLAFAARMIAAHYGLTKDDVSGCAMPLFHVHGLVGSCLSALVVGGSVVVHRRLSPSRFLATLSSEGVTWFSASPTIHKMLLDRAEMTRTELPLERLRFVRSCSSPLPVDLLRRAEDFFGVPMLDAYGMTEASHQMCANPPPPGRRVVGSVGPPTGVELSITDPDGVHLDAGQAGEVVIRGASVTPGYLGNAQANEQAFVDGWFRTGDRGVIDKNGYLRLEGRIKEMILRGGENISPYEVEEVLLSHPAVVEAVSFAKADEKYGEEVAAAVVLESAVSDRDLMRFCGTRLAPFKVPKKIWVVDAIPRTATGKVQRSRLAAILADERRA